MNKYPLVPLTKVAEIHDYLRKPISQAERNKRQGPYPYYGATGQIDWIDNYRQDGKYVLLGEDGAPFLDPLKSKAYIVEGKCWVNNHAHVLKGKADIYDDDFLCFALNWADYSYAVTGSTRLKLPQKTMNLLLVPYPDSISKQREIALHIKRQFAEVKKARKTVEAQLQEAKLLSAHFKKIILNDLNHIPRTSLGNCLLGIEAGKSFKTTDLLASPDELGILKVSAVSWQEFKPQEAKAVHGSYTPNECHRVKAGDLLISRANTLALVGAVVSVKGNYPNRLLSDKTLRLVANEERFNKDYLLTILRLPEARSHIENNATGTSDSMRNISQKTIKATPIPDISLEHQEKIVTKFKQNEKEVNVIERSSLKALEELNLLSQKILSKAFEI